MRPYYILLIFFCLIIDRVMLTDFLNIFVNGLFKKKKKKSTLEISINFYLIDIYNLNIEVVKSVHKSLFEYFLIMASIHLIG